MAEGVPIPALTAALVGLGLIFAVAFLKNGGQFDAQPDTGVNDQPNTNGIAATAKAIANAEGYGIAGAIPTLAHNPGDLVIPGWAGAKLGEGISVFSSDAEGWSRLYRELNLIAAGESAVYSLSDTITTMGDKWAGDSNWANNVAAYLGVDPSTTLAEVLA